MREHARNQEGTCDREHLRHRVPAQQIGVQPIGCLRKETIEVGETRPVLHA